MTQNELTMNDMSFYLVIRQQPLQSRVCGVGEKVDRRPIDPPLIVELQITSPSSSTTNATLKEKCMTQLFLTAVLVPSSINTSMNNDDGDDDDDPHRHLPKVENASTSSNCLDLSVHAQLTVGRTVSSLYHFKDLDGLTKCFFVFSDLSIRIEGSYKFQLCLFQIMGSSVSFQQSILTDAFTVYSAKKFPGMFGSCPLARCFADQGLKIRIRNQSGPRQHRRRQQYPRYSNRHRLYSRSRSPVEELSDHTRSSPESSQSQSTSSPSSSSTRFHPTINNTQSLPSITSFLTSSSPSYPSTASSVTPIIPIHNHITATTTTTTTIPTTTIPTTITTTTSIASNHTPASFTASSQPQPQPSVSSSPQPPLRLPPFSDFIQSVPHSSN